MTTNELTAVRIAECVTIDPVTGCWNWNMSKDRDGYGRLYLDGKNLSAHRTSYTVFVGEIPKGLLICHHCDRPQCVNPAHLFVGTNADNRSDAVGKGRQARYENTRSGKLTEEDVADVVRRANGGETYATIAKDYGVDTRTTSYWGRRHGINRGKGWKSGKGQAVTVRGRG